jgi:hypothetical protein
MNKTIDSRPIILRLKLLEAILTKNVAKYGSMSPFVEATWNKEIWSSKISKDGHQRPKWDDYHIFDSPEASPLQLKLFHSSLFFAPQEIGCCVVPIDDLYKGLSKEWLDLLHEGKVTGKLRVTLNMYEEKRSEQSTLNTSYAVVDLKEEYLRKSNELELEKEELEFYKRKYKKKKQKLFQEVKNYKNTLKKYLKQTTVTEESLDDDSRFFNHDLSHPELLKSQVSIDLHEFKTRRNVVDKKRIFKYSTLADSKFEDFGFGCRKVESDLETCQGSSAGQSDTLELRFEHSNQFSSPRRVVTPNSVESCQSAKVKTLGYFDKL